MARPTTYTDELGDEIAAQSAQGKSLKAVCAGRGMPSLRTVFEWRRKHPAFAMLLVAALVDRASLYFEESIEIADEKVTDAVAVSRNRTRVQARQWSAARLDPARFSERLINAHVLPSDPERPFAEVPRKEQMAMAREIAYALHLGLKVRRELDASNAGS